MTHLLPEGGGPVCFPPHTHRVEDHMCGGADSSLVILPGGAMGTGLGYVQRGLEAEV